VSIRKYHLPFECVSPADKHCFFGYFDKFPWDKSGRYLLAHKIDFTARQPVPGEKAVLGRIDLENNNEFLPFAESDAWCWQQGCMLQWLNDRETAVIYNDREGDHFVSRIYDFATGRTETLCRPVYCLSNDGKWALSVNFSRLDRERPGYGYPGAYDPCETVKIPENDGIYLVDLKNNSAELILSVAEITERFFRSDMEDAPGWFNHLLFSPDSSRIAFFHRWRLYNPGGSPGGHRTHMFTAKRDGTDIWPLNLEDMSSHYTWKSNSHIINFSNRYKQGWQYYLYTDKTNISEAVLPDTFPGDGHCSFSPDGKWMLTDTYPDEQDKCRRVYICRVDLEEVYEIGAFYSDPSYPLPTRCDLHPNWSRDGRKVCIDSIHENFRGIYIADVTPLTGK